MRSSWAFTCPGPAAAVRAELEAVRREQVALLAEVEQVLVEAAAMDDVHDVWARSDADSDTGGGL